MLLNHSVVKSNFCNDVIDVGPGAGKFLENASDDVELLSLQLEWAKFTHMWNLLWG